MPIVCTCQAVVPCGAVGAGGANDGACAAHTPTFFRALTTSQPISLRDLVLTISGTVGGLRNWIAQQYTKRNIGLGAWTDPVLYAGTKVRLIHFTEINTRIDALTACRCNCNQGASGGCGCHSDTYMGPGVCDCNTHSCTCVTYTCTCVTYCSCNYVSNCSGEAGCSSEQG